MNTITIIGRLTKDPDVKTGRSSGKSFVKFTVAVDRTFKDAQGNKQTDFLICKAFGKTADFIGTYFVKGSKIGLTGSMQIDSYTAQDGTEQKETYILVNDVEFVDSKSTSAPAPSVQGANKKVQASLDMFQAEAKAAAESGALPFEV